jgi:hypothetical protein
MQREESLMQDGAGGSLTTDPTLRDLLDAHCEAYFAKYHAPILGRVQTYDPATQLADVEPLVILRAEGLDLTRAPILRGVPVAFPGGAGLSITWPLEPGNPLELIPQDADFGAYWASGVVGRLPTSKRRFSLSDCVAIPVASRSQVSPLPALAWALDGIVHLGLTYLGGSDASLMVALDTDQVPKNSLMGTWMTQVEGFINGLVPGTVTPLSTTFTSIGNVQATSTKAKAK